MSNALPATAKSARSYMYYNHLPLQEKINFARHLALVIKAGLPIFEGLKIIRGQSTSKTMTRILDQAMEDVNNGKFLSDSLENFKGVFGTFFINVVRVGEVSGTLSENLMYLSLELRKSKELKSKIRSAMIYPIIILVATVGVVAFLAFVVLPKLLPILHGLNVPLPLATKILIRVVDFIQHGWYWLLLGVIVMYVLARLVLMVRSIRYVFHWMIFFMPVVSPLVVSVNMVVFSRVLKMLMKSGIKIVEALDITANTFNNLVYQDIVLKANEEVKKGGQLATVLAAHHRYFPPLVSGMIQVGENTGNLEDNLGYIAEYNDEEVDNKLRNLTSFLEPIMLLIMGLLVGYVAISIITPIYSISQGVK